MISGSNRSNIILALAFPFFFRFFFLDFCLSFTTLVYIYIYKKAQNHPKPLGDTCEFALVPHGTFSVGGSIVQGKGDCLVL